jgi:polysaccharide biosynthesis/export protein
MSSPQYSKTIKSILLTLLVSYCEVIGFSQTTVVGSPDSPIPAHVRDTDRTYPASVPTQQPADLSLTISPDQSHYIISPGDLIEIVVFGVPELSQRTSVNASGDIYMPLVNYIHVAGLDIQRTQSAIEKALRAGEFIKTPHVSVAVVQYTGGIVVMGEITKPGIYPLIGAGRLFDIVTEAGGITGNAGQVISITHRDGTQETVFLSTSPKLQMQGNIPLSQGDTIIVSKAGVIYVVGEILSPSGFIMDEKGPYTVMKLVAMAHGITKLANTSKARIVRRTPEGQAEIPVRLDKILVSQAPDIPLESNDILFVPTSGAKKAAQRAGDFAIALATGVTIITAERF